MVFSDRSTRFNVPFYRSSLVALPMGLVLLALSCSSSDSSDKGNHSQDVTTDQGGTAGSDNTGGHGGTTASGGQGGATGGSGGTESSGGSGGTSSGGTGGTSSGGQGGAPAGGTAGTAAGGDNSGGTGGSSGAGDTPPVRDLMIDTNAAVNGTITFTAKQLDPMAGVSPTDTHADSQEYAVVDTRKPIQGKLVMTMGGIGTCCGQGGIGGFAVGLGFHHMAIAMETEMPDAINQYKNMDTDEANRQPGDARMETFDGIDRVSFLDINVHDSFAYRAAVALKYMQQQDPGGDWAYFLNADDTVRWSDVYLVGYSYGSQTLAMVSKYVRIGRGIATSGPEDEGFPNATWIHAVSATPLDRMYGLFGSDNVGDKVVTSQAAGWLGDPVTVAQNATLSDLDMAHLFILQGQGHSEFCAGDGGPWKALCTYAFGVTQ